MHTLGMSVTCDLDGGNVMGLHVLPLSALRIGLGSALRLARAESTNHAKALPGIRASFQG